MERFKRRFRQKFKHELALQNEEGEIFIICCGYGKNDEKMLLDRLIDWEQDRRINFNRFDAAMLSVRLAGEIIEQSNELFEDDPSVVSFFEEADRFLEENLGGAD